MRWFVIVSCCLLFAAAVAGEIVISAPDALIFGGVAMAPARPLAELLGATVSVQGKAITLTRAGKTFTCTPGQTTAQANGREISLPLAPFTRVGVAYVPLRALITAWGGKITLEKLDFIGISFPGRPYFPCLAQKWQKGSPAAYRDSDPELYAVNLDGTGLRRLTYDTDAMTLPAFSPDGSKFVMDIGGSLVMRCMVDLDFTRFLLTVSRFDNVTGSIENYDISFSPDGRTVLFRGGDTVRLIDIDPVGIERDLAKGRAPCFSPDGTTIAYIDARPGREGIIMLMDRNGGNRRMLPREIFSGTCPVFSRDGKMLYALGYDEQARPVLYGYPLAANGEIGESRIIIPYPDASTAHLHPDGSRYVFSMDRKDGVYTRQIDGTGLRHLTTDETSAVPRYTPDGAYILFERPNTDARSRGSDLWIMRADGSDPRPLVTGMYFYNEGTAGNVGLYGVITPDGKQLLFLACPEIVPNNEDACY